MDCCLQPLYRSVAGTEALRGTQNDQWAAQRSKNRIRQSHNHFRAEAATLQGATACIHFNMHVSGAPVVPSEQPVSYLKSDDDPENAFYMILCSSAARVHGRAPTTETRCRRGMRRIGLIDSDVDCTVFCHPSTTVGLKSCMHNALHVLSLLLSAQQCRQQGAASTMGQHESVGPLPSKSLSSEPSKIVVGLLPFDSRRMYHFLGTRMHFKLVQGRKGACGAIFCADEQLHQPAKVLVCSSCSI
jgi:hypothetical protein